ncbi:MAG: hypothetical protein JSW50_15705 [Candidatus Latescibacterota bacterium]|nr:MAG: hypothetical protein JSW50_15705 [Candidatus Latescibacterota bacterium]
MVPGKEEIPIGKRPRILSLPFLGLVLVGFVSSGLLDFFPPLFRLFCVFALFSYLPGELLWRRVLDRRWPYIETRIPLCVLIGLSLYSVVTWVCWLTGMSFSAYTVTLQWTAAGFFAAFVVDDLLRKHKRREQAGLGMGCARWIQTGLLVPLVIVIAGFFAVFPPAVGHQGDAFVHIGYLRGMIDDNSLEPKAVLGPVGLTRPENADTGNAEDAGTNGKAPESVAADPRQGTLHLILAASAVFSNLDPLRLWILLPALLAPVAVLAFVAFASALLPSAAYVAFALVLFLMFQGGIGREFLGSVAYGQHFSLVYFWMLFVICVRSWRFFSWRDLAVVLLLVLGGTLIHIDVAIHFGLMFLSFVLFKRVFRLSWRRLAWLGAGGAACATVVFVWKIALSYSGGNALHSHPQGLLYFFDIGDAFYILSPAEIIRRNGLMYGAGVAMAIPLLLVARRRRSARMNLALAVPPVLVALNPWVAPVVYSEAAYLLHRFLLNIPALTITALAIGSLISWGRRGNVFRKAVAVLVVFVWARVLVVGVTIWAADMSQIRPGGAGPVLSRPLTKAVRYINSRVPKNAVVLSDPVTSYALSAFTHARVVAVLGQHGNPNDRHSLDRLKAIQTVLSPYITQIESVMAVRRFNVDYILVNGSFNRPVHEFMADWDPAFAPLLQSKIGSLRGVFEEVYDNEGITIFKVVGTVIHRITWDVAVPFIEDVPTNLDVCEDWPADSPVEVTGIRIDPPVALPGEEVKVTVSYRRAGESVPAFPLWLHLRFEDSDYFDTAGVYPGDKYVRRYRERRDAAFRRFRVSRRVFDGFYPVQAWPWTGDSYERFTVRLPTDLVETVYEVQCKVTEEALLPNFAFADFVYNDDSYVGTPCTHLEIKTFTTR